MSMPDVEAVIERIMDGLSYEEFLHLLMSSEKGHKLVCDVVGEMVEDPDGDEE